MRRKNAGQASRHCILSHCGAFWGSPLIALFLAIWGPLALAENAAAADPPYLQAPPAFQTTDANGVDLVRAQASLPSPEISIGDPQAGGISYRPSFSFLAEFTEFQGSGISTNLIFQEDNFKGYIAYAGSEGDGTEIFGVTVLGQTTLFRSLDGQFGAPNYSGGFTPYEGGAGRLVVSNSGGTWTFTAPDGAVAQFTTSTGCTNPGLVIGAGSIARLSTLTRPSGETLTYYYKQQCAPNSTDVRTIIRTQAIVSNRGYQVRYEYQSNPTATNFSSATGIQQFFQLNRVVLFDMTQEYCDPTAMTCTLSGTWPSLTFTRTASETAVTDTNGAVTRYAQADSTTTYFGRMISGVRFPTSANTADIALTLGAAKFSPSVGYFGLSDYSTALGNWHYNVGVLSPPWSGQATTIVTDPFGEDTNITFGWHPTTGYVVVTPYTIVRADSVVDPLNAQTSYTYTSDFRLARTQLPEGNASAVTYDARGNVNHSEMQAKPSAPATALAMNVSISTTCTNWIVCNQPNSVTDARGNTTDYTYDATHGGVLTRTLPADSNGVRAQVRYTYGQFYARQKNSSGTLVNAATPVWRVTSERTCTSAQTCDGTANDVLTEYTYEPDHALVASVTVRAGDNSVSRTTAYTYDTYGNRISEDGPLSGTGDTTYFRYDAMRRLTATIRPDPDGAGPAPYTITRTTYDLRGRPTAVDEGTIASSSAALSTMSVTRSVTSTYSDASDGKLVKQVQSAGGVDFAVTQYSYDARGRVECTAVRMNPAVFSSLPSSACTLGTEGSNGPDRISRNVYDQAGRLTTVHRAYGTPLQQNNPTYSYTVNGQRAFVEDANGNRSTYSYDTFDRLTRITFPSTTPGAHAANPSDYEEYGLDANGNRTSLRLRSGETINYTFDALNREVLRDIPGGTSSDVYSRYDLMGRRLYARFGAGGSASSDCTATSVGIDYCYDALSRLTRETSYGRMMAYQYDAAGNRTRLTWPDAFYVAYTYDIAGHMDQIGENGVFTGASLLADYAYDALGRRDTLARGNSDATDWGYDGLSRLTSLQQDLAGGTANDQTLTFSYGPSSQILQRQAANDNYNWTFPTTTNAYVPDGLNRYASVASTPYTYDGRQNLTNDGARAFCYDLENHLLGVAPAANDACTSPSTLALSYDPLGRLLQTVASSGTTQFLYDGDRLVAEYDGSNNLLRRYVHGAGVDEPLLWYEGAGTTDRRYLITDHQGSVIAADGSSTTLYRYGPYGEPDAWSGARFRYTGQAMLPEAQLYHYKARVYDPNIGRFLQTDPIGYKDDWDLYAYVANDPMNASDPSGEDTTTCVQQSGGDGAPISCVDSGVTVTVSVATQQHQVQSNANAIAVPLFVQGVTIIGEGVVYELSGAALFRGLGIAAEAGAGVFGRALRACGCFVAGTLVATPDGERRIEDIRVGDQVLAWNETTGEIAPHHVTALIRPDPKPVRVLILRDANGQTESFEVTDDHPWFVVGKGWMRTDALHPSDHIEAEANGDLVVVSLSEPGRIAQTYNLEVEGWHTFLVGHDRAVVHNVDCNKLIHLFGKAEHQLGALLQKFGGNREAAFNAVQAAANRELAAGRLAVGPNGRLPDVGAVLNINGELIQLAGGRVMNGSVAIGSFSAVIRVP